MRNEPKAHLQDAPAKDVQGDVDATVHVLVDAGSRCALPANEYIENAVFAGNLLPLGLITPAKLLGGQLASHHSVLVYAGISTHTFSF
jgi:hypothetical protein